MLACRHQYHHVMRLLLEAGADVRVANKVKRPHATFTLSINVLICCSVSQRGHTMQAIAWLSGNSETLSLLIDFGLVEDREDDLEQVEYAFSQVAKPFRTARACKTIT